MRLGTHKNVLTLLFQIKFERKNTHLENNRSFDRVVLTKLVIDTYASDHVSILCYIDCCKPAQLNENVSVKFLFLISFI